MVLERIKNVFSRSKRQPKKTQSTGSTKDRWKREALPLKPPAIVVYRCNVCGFTTGSRKEIRRHVREAHRDIFSLRRDEVKWSYTPGKDGSARKVYTPAYAKSPRQTRYHLSEMYSRVIVRR